MAVLAEPRAGERGESHQPERMIHRAAESPVDEIPGQGGDDVREALGGFVARPARRNGGDRARLQQHEPPAGEPPLDVLRKAEP